MILKYSNLDYCFHWFLFPFKGHNVTEVAHDCVVALNNWHKELFWHGMVGSLGDSLSLTLQVLWHFFNLVKIYEHCILVFVYCLHSTIGTKGVAKEMKKICSGPRCDEGVKWFTELSDKGLGRLCLRVCFGCDNGVLPVRLVPRTGRRGHVGWLRDVSWKFARKHDDSRVTFCACHIRSVCCEI